MRDLLRRAFFHHRRGYRSLAFVLVGAVALGAYATLIHIPDSSVPGWVLAARKEAVRTSIAGQRAIASYRVAHHIAFSPEDRFATGMLGVARSPITTELGSPASKRTSANPVFAAAVVQMLFQAGVQPGDVVAVGMTGSYPAFDLDVLAAIQAVRARPIVFSSLGASEYGANEPGLTWLDMERILFADGIIHHRSDLVSPGGSLVGKTYAFRRTLTDRSGLPEEPVLPPSEDVQFRMQAYQTTAVKLGRPIAAFVNVGGASANIGPAGSESIIAPGLSRPRWSPYQASQLGVLGRMALRGVPIIAMFNTRALAKQFQVAYDPKLRPTAKDIAPPPPNPWATAGALLLLIGVVAAVHRAGLFRVPNWELPPALLARRRLPNDQQTVEATASADR